MNLVYIWNKVLKKMRGAAIAGSTIHSTSKVEAGSQFINSSMDQYSFCGYDCKILNCDIGAFCSIADGVIIGGAQHPIEWVGTSPVFYKGKDSVTKKYSEFERPKAKRTIIGNDVWIGDRAIIKGGVTVGNGAIIGMGSIVTKDIGDFEIWAGNPAKLIRKRFSEDIIQDLIKLSWWEWDDFTIQKYSQYIRNPEQFINQVEKEIKK